MPTHSEWSNTVNRHVNLLEKVLSLAERRIKATEKAADHIDNVLGNGDHPEILPAYVHNMRMAINIEELEGISRVISRCSRDVRLLTAGKYHDPNSVAIYLDSLGYKVVPKQEIVASSVNKGLTDVAVLGIRKALEVEIIGNK